MRKYIFLLIFLAVSAQVVKGQDTTPPEEPQEQAEKPNRKRWISRTEFGLNRFWGDDADSLATSSEELGSIKWNSATQYRAYFGPSPLYVGLGIGYAINEYRFRDNIILDYNKTTKQYRYSPDTVSGNSYGKSKFQVITLRLPIEVGIQVKKFNLAAGAYADYILYAKHKRKFENDDVHYRVNVRGFDRLRLNEFQYGVSARVAYGVFGVFAN
jgi:hypothetical protein